MRDKCPYSDFFWSVFSGVRTKNGDFRTQPECDKIHTGKTPSMATFYTVFIISFKHIQYHIQPIFLHLTLIKHLFAAFLFSRDQNYVQNDLYCKISLIMMI